MSTRFAVDVQIAALPEGGHEGRCTCSCGWSLTTHEPTSQMATRVSDRARANHFEDVHPDQRSRAATVHQPPPEGHSSALSGSIREGFGWRRSVVCACDWEVSVVGRTPLEAASIARHRHRRHARTSAGATPRLDRFTVWGLLAVAIAAILAAAAYVVTPPL